MICALESEDPAVEIFDHITFGYIKNIYISYQNETVEFKRHPASCICLCRFGMIMLSEECSLKNTEQYNVRWIVTCKSNDIRHNTAKLSCISSECNCVCLLIPYKLNPLSF